MIRINYIIIMTLLGHLFIALTATALQDKQENSLTIGLTEDMINVDAGFSGAKVTLFGVINTARQTDDTQIIATVIGPRKTVSIRPIVKTGIIWAAAEQTSVNNVPGLYYVLSSMPLGDFLPLQTIASNQLDINGLNFQSDPTIPVLPDNMRTALIQKNLSQGLYQMQPSAIHRIGNGLFSVDINLPAATPVGAYTVQVSAWQNGKMISADSAQLLVDKAGLERQLYEFAHKQSLLYGLMCVALSLLAGWAVSLVFRRL